MTDWWQYQAKKLLGKGKPAPLPIPAYKRRYEPDKVEPPSPAPIMVEETTASDTAIQRIIAYWKKP